MDAQNKATVDGDNDNNNHRHVESKDSRKLLVKYLSSRSSSAGSSTSESHWVHYNENDEEFIRRIPKVELHVHLDGAFDPDYLWNYIEQNRPQCTQRLPKALIPPWDPNNTLYVQDDINNCSDAYDYHTLCTCRGRRSLAYMLNCFQYFLPLVSNQIMLIEQLAYDFVKRQYEQNVIYTEVRYSPHELCKRLENNDNNDGDDNSNNITADMIVQTVTRGLRRGIGQYPHVIINQILCAITWHPEWADDVVELAIKYRHDYPCAIVGVDIAAGEEHFDSINFPNLYHDHYRMCQKAKEYNIPISIHAGETGTITTNQNTIGSHVKRAIDEYGATRIGHGYRIVHDIELMKYVKEKNIHFEICPTSSDETGGWDYQNDHNVGSDSNSNNNDDTMTNTNHKDWSKHPAVIMYKDNQITNMSINSDDPAVFHTSLSWQYRIALMKMKHFTKQDLIHMNINAIQNAAFGLSDTDKQCLVSKLYKFATLYKIDINNNDQINNDLNDDMNVMEQHQQQQQTNVPFILEYAKDDNIDDYFRDRVYIENELF